MVALGLDDALLGWLVASAGNVLVGRLRSDRARKAMRELGGRAVAEAVAEVASHLDEQQARQLCQLLQEHDAPLDRTATSSLDELRAALKTWIAELDDPDSRKRGTLAALGVDAGVLGETLTERIAAGIREHGRAGGPLAPVADWLWRDEMSSDLSEIKLDLRELRSAVKLPSSNHRRLPGGIRDFTGRRPLLDELDEQIRAHDPTGNVVDIHAVDGMAGVGKTELALRAAHQHKHRYPDGQYFINLHGYTDAIPPMPPEMALEELLRQAGISGAEMPSDLAGRQARWQALMANRRSLIMLDNALDANHVRSLLPSATGCLVLITSRTRLHDLPGVRTWSLDVLPPVDAIELFTRVANTERHLDREAIARAVDIVGRLPVAVRAIASQVDDDYTEAELVDDLAEARSRADLMEAGGPLGAAVHAAFETSLKRLDQPLQNSFYVLGLCPGPDVGVPQFAALAHLSPGQARRMLRALTVRSLMTPAVTSVGHRRYQLHDLLREYARRQASIGLTEGERSAAHDRLISWYSTAITLVENLTNSVGAPAVEAMVKGLKLDGPEQAQAWLAAEQDNLLALAADATGSFAAHVFYRYALRLHDLCYFATAWRLYDLVARMYLQVRNQPGRADTMLNMGEVARLTGDYPGASSFYQAALTVYQRIGDRGGEADVHSRSGYVAMYTGDLPGAGKHFQTAQGIYRQIGYREGEARALCGLAEIALRSGNHEEGAQLFQAALGACRQAGYRLGEVRALWGLAQAALRTGDLRNAHDQFQTAFSICKRIGYRVGEADVRSGLAQAALRTGNIQEAREQFQTALEICRLVGYPIGEARAAWGLGEVTLHAGDPAGAADQFHAALIGFRKTGNRFGEARALWGLGQTALHAGDSAGAADRFHAALIGFGRIGYLVGEADARLGLGQTALCIGDLPSARAQFEVALEVCRRIRYPFGEANAEWGLGQAAAANGQHGEGQEHRQKSMAIFAEIGSPPPE